MKDRIAPIVLEPSATIEQAMMAMEDGKTTGAPAGIVIIVPSETDEINGVVTDGDIRRAIVQGLGLDTPLSEVMSADPLVVPDSSSATAMLRHLHKELGRREDPENKYHHIVVVDEKRAVLDVVTPFELWKRSEVRINTAAVVGLGFVGLTFALTLADAGVSVQGIEKDPDIREKLQNGVTHFHERGLEPMLNKHVGETMTVHSDVSEADSDIYILCVNTPIDGGESIDTSALQGAAREVGENLSVHDLVIVRSTVATGTCRDVVLPTLEAASDLVAGQDFFVAYAPERTIAGNALNELKSLPQVIGGINKSSTDYASQLFGMFSKTTIPVSSLEAAETVKLLNNSYRDLRFAFANETAKICNEWGLDTHEVIHAANEGYDRNQIPTPSPGVGGACLTKDPYFLELSGKRRGYDPVLPAASREVNETMIDYVAQKVRRFLDEEADGETKVFVMGMAFKGEPETSDMRHSPSVEVCELLSEFVDELVVYDPVVNRERLEAADRTVVDSLEDGFTAADCVMIMTNHRSFERLNVHDLADEMNDPSLLFDPWAVLYSDEVTSLSNVTYDRFSGSGDRPRTH
jgi:nucleotide sugar dehydrogenase